MTIHEDIVEDPYRAVVWIARASVFLSALYTLGAFGQTVMVWVYFPAGAFNAPEGTPRLAAWCLSHAKVLSPCLLVLSVGALASSLGLLWKKEWAIVPYTAAVGGLLLFVAAAGLVVVFVPVPAAAALRIPLALASVLVGSALAWALKTVTSTYGRSRRV